MKRTCGALSLLGVVAVASAGCGGTGSVQPGEELSARDTLGVLRAAHGASRWKAAAGVRFSYRLSLPTKGQAVSLGVAFRRDDLQHLWVTPGAGKAPLCLRLDAPRGSLAEALAAGGAMGPGDATAPGETDALRSTLDDSLRAIRYSFCLPLTTLQGRWEFRGLTAPPGIPRPPVLEIFSLEPGVPFTRSWIVRDGRTGLLSRALFEFPPGATAGRNHEVVFEGYEETAGIAVARSRRHAPAASRGSAAGPADPFFRIESEEPLRFEEEVLDVRLLSAGEADAACPLPSEESAPPEPEGTAP